MEPRTNHVRRAGAAVLISALAMLGVAACTPETTGPPNPTTTTVPTAPTTADPVD